jgi:prepilin-type N-terminal cleavage/methylation domain-containing protein
MKRNYGFTLAEVLVTLGIIGVIAAIAGPLMNNIRPDVEKMTYLKTYDMLSKSLNEIVREQKYYPLTNNESYSGYPLLDTTNVTLSDGKTAGGDNKIAYILANYMGANIVENISDDYVMTYPKKSNFFAKNGVGFFVTTKKQDNGGSTYTYQTDIYIDTNGPDKGKNCQYGEAECSRPDVYKLSLAADGRLIAADPLGAKYIANRHSFIKEKIQITEDFLTQFNEAIRNNALFIAKVDPITTNNDGQTDNSDSSQTEGDSSTPYYLESSLTAQDWNEKDKKPDFVPTEYDKDTDDSDSNDDSDSTAETTDQATDNTDSTGSTGTTGSTGSTGSTGGGDYAGSNSINGTAYQGGCNPGFIYWHCTGTCVDVGYYNSLKNPNNCNMGTINSYEDYLRNTTLDLKTNAQW